MYCRSLFVLLPFFFWPLCCLSSLLTDSYYPFGIFKLFLPSPLLIFQTFFYRSLGITCKKISGYAKGYSHKAGDVISYEKKTNHAWNVVELDGTWQFIETTWGAGHVDKNKKFNKQFNNFCFLTPPQSFITDHFPYINNNIEESKQWQLLENPLTLEVYSKCIKPSEK